MKHKKLWALCLTLALMLIPGLMLWASADGTTTTYTLTIPATLTVANSGWNATTGITANNATNDFDTGKKLTVTAASTNNWALVSDSNSIGYNLATADGTYSSTATPASWEFPATELNAASGTTKTMGIIVEDYSDKPAGTYQDTVTFTTQVVTVFRTVTFSTSSDGNTINKDGVTCNVVFDTYNCLIGGATFSVSSGNFTKIVITAQDALMAGRDPMTMNPIEGWSSIPESATWEGKATSVSVGDVNGNNDPVTIVFTIEE